LTNARDRMSEAERKFNAAQSVADTTAEVSAVLQHRRPWWQRAIGLLTGQNAHYAARMREAALADRKAQSALTRAYSHRQSEEGRLVVEIERHKKAVKEYAQTWMERAKAADAKAIVTARTREILRLLPGTAALGSAGLHRLGEKFLAQQQSRRDEYDPGIEAPHTLPF